MYHSCCSLTRTPRAIPLISRVSKRPNSSPNQSRNPLYSYPSSSPFSETLVCGGLHGTSKRRTTTTMTSTRASPVLKPASFRAMFLSTAADNSQLPWIASSASASAYKERQGKVGLERTKKKDKLNRANVSSSPSSSWEDSANKYFSRNSERSELSPTEDNRGWSSSRVGNHEYRRSPHRAREDGGEERLVEPADGEDAEPVDDPRWDRIKNKYRGFIDRGSRLEKPEVRRWDKQENWGRKMWKEATDSSVPKMVGQGIYGVGPVLAALTVERREFYALYVQEGLDLTGNNRKKKDKKGVEKVLKLAEKIGLNVVEASKHDLNMIVDNRPHQGLVLDASPLEMVNVRELEAPASTEIGKAPLWVALDEVMDPQNLGAIVRSAYFFGAEGVVLCAKNSAPLSGVVSKASAGSLELIELRSCKNMMQFLSSSIENGWRVLGGSVSSKSRPLSEVESGVPTILVLGSEGTGLRPLVERSCTHLIRIPGNMPILEFPWEAEQEPEEMDHGHPGRELKSFLAVESLNVSVAAGVLLYHLGGNNTPLVDTKPKVDYD